MSIYTSPNHSALVETGGMLRQFRESKGWTLAEMSKKLGMREEQILAIEEGKEDHFKKKCHTTFGVVCSFVCKKTWS